MILSLSRSVVWAPTIALSWLWGLGFFYAIHVTLTYGWLGFVAFAAPNAFGLFLFGWVLGSPGRDPGEIFKSIRGAYAGLFLFCQLGAIAITVFGFVAYLWLPMVGLNAAIAVLLLVLFACAVGHSVSLVRLKFVHVAYLIIGVAAALFALNGLHLATDAELVPLSSFDNRFYGLALPTLVGFLLGPWIDVQQWQRAIEIRRDGCSVRVAYGLGALVFLGLLTINALLAAAAGKGVIISADGIPAAQPAVALAIARDDLGTVAIAFLIWTTVAAISTIDSFYIATRWFLTSITSQSLNPVLAFVPSGIVSSPLWIMVMSLVVAAAVISADLSLMYLMVPFATVLVGGAACLVLETLGTRRRYDPVLCYMIGLASALIFLIGYIGPVTLFIALAPVIALIGALPMMIEFLFRRRADPVVTDPAAEISTPKGIEAKATTITLTKHDTVASHGFDGQWFVLQMMPTYDDTNSVGNVYFANYVRWVGKARELFFNVCMPDFDLKTTNYYVLTRSFQHDFRREASEFEPVTVRIEIASHNRKFVTLRHEIFSDEQGLLGHGEQSLMFVDTVNYRPLDIPRDIISGFLPYWPKNSPHGIEPANALKPVEDAAVA